MVGLTCVSQHTHTKKQVWDTSTELAVRGAWNSACLENVVKLKLVGARTREERGEMQGWPLRAGGWLGRRAGGRLGRGGKSNFP